MTTELMKTNECNLILPSDAPMGFEGVDVKSLPTPRWRLVQSLSKSFRDQRARAGQLENSLTGDIINGGEEFVFIKYSKGAALFEDGGGGLICKSNDGVKNTEGKLCEQCPHDAYYKNWGEDGKTKPGCAESVNLFAVRRSTILSDMPDVGIVTMSKISFKAGMQIVAMAALKKKPLYCWAYKLNTESQEKFKGAFAFKPQSVGFVTQEELETLVAIAKNFSNQVIETDDAQHAEPAQQSDVIDDF